MQHTEVCLRLRKMMTHYLTGFVFLTFLLCGLNLGQDLSEGGNKKPRTHDDYVPRTLNQIFAMKPDESDLRDMQGRLVVTKDILPSMVQVTFAGSMRPLPQSKKETIRQWARLYAGSIEHYTEPYQDEMLFIENGVRYWLAVHKNSALLQERLKRGVALNLYLIRLGAPVVDGKYDWTLLVEDFQEARTSKPPAEVEFRGMRFGKPPLINLTFDVVLRNKQASSRWFLLPANLGTDRASLGEKGGVDALEVFAPSGKGRVIIGRFLGTGGFHALLLPPHAEIRLRRFPISYWGEPPESVQIEIVIAKNLRIGGEAAENWFGGEPLSSAVADIIQDAENPMSIEHSRRTPDNREVSSLMETERRLQLKVSLKQIK